MKKKWIYLLTALTLAVGVCAAKPMIGGAAPLDLKQDCSITIYPESKEKRFGEDLETNAHVVVDVYKVADAVKVPGYDTYSYEFKGVYADLELSKEPKAEDWKKMAQEAAKIALEESAKGKEAGLIGHVDATAERKPQVLSSFEDETATGLYLLIARSRDMSEIADYKINIGSKDGDIASIAVSDNYTYIFSPELISMPMRGQNNKAEVMGPSSEEENGPLPSGMTGDYTYMTSDEGEWVYNLDVYLKPVRVRRYGSLEIRKKLNVYESEDEVLEPTVGGTGQDEQVTFVFRASWEDPDTKEKTSKVDSLTFPIINKDGSKSYDWQLYMDRIPVGTEVSVEEIYSGASYDNITSPPQTQKVTITAEKIQNGIALLNNNNTVKTIISSSEEGETQPEGPREEVEASVAFTNTYNWEQKKGYGIKNIFTYDENGKWVWTSDPKQEAGDPGMPIFDKERSHLDVEQSQ